MSFSISVQVGDFNVGEEYNHLTANNTSAGAVVFFVGRVRGASGDGCVTELSLEHYPGMTEKVLQQILEESQSRWQLIAARIVHRVGDLSPGDHIVFVGTVSAHREHAFQSAEFIMDILKTTAPFWKKEMNEKGEVNWLSAAEKDVKKAERWD